jgi:hypothetical protein
VTLLINEETNEYGGLSLWQTEPEAEAAMTTLDANLQKRLGDRLIGKPVIRIFEVYEPKAQAQTTSR